MQVGSNVTCRVFHIIRLANLLERIAADLVDCQLLLCISVPFKSIKPVVINIEGVLAFIKHYYNTE